MKSHIGMVVVALALALGTAAAALAQTPSNSQSPTGAYIGGYQRAPGPYYGGTGSAEKTPVTQDNQGGAQAVQPLSLQDTNQQTGQTAQKSNNQ